MSYSVKNLRDDFGKHIFDLGIDSKFLENPAFASAISEIDGLIGEMNMLEDSNSVMVEEGQGSISFNYSALDGTRYSASIYSTSPNTFSCIRTEERAPISTDNGIVNQKSVVEKVVNIDTLGSITIDSNNSTVNNLNCESWNCNEISSGERKTYTSDGVMTMREYKHFPEIKINSGITNMNAGSMLLRPRQGFVAGNFADSYEKRTFLVRDQFDTAKVRFEDKATGAKYSSVLPLSQLHGLRDMTLDNDSIFSPEVEILPMSQYDADQIIQKESNQKVADGLRKIAVGRENYYYKSTNDISFVCDDGAQSKGVSR